MIFRSLLMIKHSKHQTCNIDPTATPKFFLLR
jgi:hypothetical protein